MSDTPHEKIYMSLEDFLALPESHQRTELINGEVIVSPAPHDYHQKVVTLLPIVLAPLVQTGELRVAPSGGCGD